MGPEDAVDPTVLAAFARQVRRAPEATACVHDGQATSYATVNERARQLAELLVSLDDNGAAPC